MTPELTIVDYGAGNIGSVLRAFERIGARARLATRPEDLRNAGRIVLPGVGAAAAVLTGLRATGMDAALAEAALSGGRPMLAICVGMQVLAQRILEFGDHRGLGWIDGTVEPLSDLSDAVRMPHMGWTDVAVEPHSKSSFSFPSRAKTFYFAHSYCMRIPVGNDALLATADCGVGIAAAVAFGSVVAVQFHPEKSQIAGELLLKSFVRWNP